MVAHHRCRVQTYRHGKRNMRKTQLNDQEKLKSIEGRHMISVQEIVFAATQNSHGQDVSASAAVFDSDDSLYEDFEDAIEQVDEQAFEDSTLFPKQRVPSTDELANRGSFLSPLHAGLIATARASAADENAIEDDRQDSPPESLLQEMSDCNDAIEVSQELEGIQEEQDIEEQAELPVVQGQDNTEEEQAKAAPSPPKTRKDSVVQAPWLRSILTLFPGRKTVSKAGPSPATTDPSYWECLPTPRSIPQFPTPLTVQQVIPTIQQTRAAQPSKVQYGFDGPSASTELHMHPSRMLTDRGGDAWAQWYAKHQGLSDTCATCAHEAAEAEKLPVTTLY